MDLAVAGDIRPHIEVFGLDQINTVLQKLGRSEIEGRLVVRIPK